MSNEKVIFPESPEAAQYKTGIEGWVSRDGRFFGGNEHLARYCGSTHKKCSCGAVILINRYCEDCRSAERLKVFNAMPIVKWDGETPLVIFDSDTYFFSEDDIVDYCVEREIMPSELDVVLCVGNFPGEISGGDQWDDFIPEGSDFESVFSKEAQEKLDELNAILRDHAPISWSEGKVRADLSAYDADCYKALNEDAE